MTAIRRSGRPPANGLLGSAVRVVEAFETFVAEGSDLDTRPLATAMADLRRAIEAQRGENRARTARVRARREASDGR